MGIVSRSFHLNSDNRDGPVITFFDFSGGQLLLLADIPSYFLFTFVAERILLCSLQLSHQKATNFGFAEVILVCIKSFMEEIINNECIL